MGSAEPLELSFCKSALTAASKPFRPPVCSSCFIASIEFHQGVELYGYTIVELQCFASGTAQPYILLKCIPKSIFARCFMYRKVPTVFLSLGADGVMRYLPEGKVVCTNIAIFQIELNTMSLLISASFNRTLSKLHSYFQLEWTHMKR